MKRIFFYVLLSGFISSIISISSYIKYHNHNNYNNEKNTDYKHNNLHLYKEKLISDNKESLKFTNSLKQSIEAVVNVKSYSQKKYSKIDPFDLFFRNYNKSYKNNNKNFINNISLLHGSGVLISDNGYIVTNNHVIHNAEKIEITLYNQKTYNAKLIGIDKNTDLALLKIQDTHLPFICFEDSDKVDIGERVFAIGYPFDLDATVTSGIISATHRSLGISNENFPITIDSFLQTDAAVNPGNSGGALINLKGKLIGINTAISSASGNFIGYSFAYPSNLVKRVVLDLEKYGKVKRIFFGIQGINLVNNYEGLLEYNRLHGTKIKSQPGCLIINVLKGSIAHNYGIKVGDIIKYADDKPLRSFSNFLYIIGTKYPGDKLKIKILRNNIIKTFDIILQDTFEKKLQKHVEKNFNYIKLLGITTKKVDESIKKKFGINYGVIVKKIDENSKLKSLGIEENEIILSINGHKIKDYNDILQIFNKKNITHIRIKSIKKTGAISISEWNILIK